MPEPDGVQGSLGEAFDAIAQTTLVGKKTRIAAHERESKLKRDAGHADESTLFFDDQKVPVETIAVANPEVAGLATQRGLRSDWRESHASPGAAPGEVTSS